VSISTYVFGVPDDEARIIFIRQSLASCLLLYGCDRNTLIDLNMLGDADMKGLPSRCAHFDIPP
jgi:hypothetical protein